VDSKLLNSLNNYIDELIRLNHKALEQAEDPTQLYRTQGAIIALRRLKLLRQEVLEKDG